MDFNEIAKTIKDYNDKILAREELTHKDSIYELKQSSVMYGRTRDSLDQFVSPRAYKIYADKVRSIDATIKYLENL